MKKSIIIVFMLIVSLCIISMTIIAVAKNEKYDPNKPLAPQIEQKILSNKKISVEHLKVSEKEKGTIAIEGLADLYGEKYYVQKIAESFPVSKLENDIIIKPALLRNDTDLERDIFKGIKRELKGSYFDDVSFKVTNGVVQLFGKITTIGLLDKIIEMVVWTPGVRFLENKLTMTMASPQDERIRNTILSSYKKDMRLAQYFIGYEPSIIIAVDGGRVTLKGYANSKVDKMIMGQIANSAIGVIKVDNQLEAPAN